MLFIVAGLVGSLVFTPVASADRGGWADPPGGWTFVEEWHAIPDSPENTGVWDHNNGSDTYSMNANSDVYAEFEIMIGPDTPVGEVARIDTIAGAGETEDGQTPAADAIVFTVIDLGDPRDVLGGSDPSDRKQFFLAPLHEPGYVFPNDDPFDAGVTFVTRFRVLPIVADPLTAGTDASTDPITFIPPASDRAQVGIGFYDPAFTEFKTLVPVGYYAENTIGIIGDGPAVLPIADNIDPTQFHTVWINAKTDPNDFAIILVRAFLDGSTTAVELSFTRDGVSDTSGDPEDVQDNTAVWGGSPELSINLGQAGTDTVGALQFDYVAATYAGAFDPAGGVFVVDWSVY